MADPRRNGLLYTFEHTDRLGRTIFYFEGEQVSTVRFNQNGRPVALERCTLDQFIAEANRLREERHV